MDAIIQQQKKSISEKTLSVRFRIPAGTVKYYRKNTIDLIYIVIYTESKKGG
jgi:hypothetical protein